MRPRLAVGGVLAAVVAALVLTQCSGDSGTDGTSSAASTVLAGDDTSVDLLVTPERIPELLRAQFGPEPSLRRINVSRDSISLELRDPAKPDNIDRWSWRDGAWTSSPVSVLQREIDEFDQVVFSPSTIDWSLIPDLVQRALDGVDLEDESVDGVSYDRLAGERPRVYIGVDGSRGSGRLIGDADGTNVEVRRN